MLLLITRPHQFRPIAMEKKRPWVQLPSSDREGYTCAILHTNFMHYIESNVIKKGVTTLKLMGIQHSGELVC